MYRDLKEGTWRSFEEQKPDQEQKIECKVMELWRVAGAHQLLPVKHPAPSIFNSCTGSTATSTLSPTKVPGIMYYLGGREATGLDFDKLFHAYCFVANLSVLLFPMSHMYNFVKHHQNTERKLRARSSETSLGQGLSNPQWAPSTCEMVAWDWKSKTRKCRQFAVPLLDYRLLVRAVCTKHESVWQPVVAEESESCPAVKLAPTTAAGFILIWKSTQQV